MAGGLRVLCIAFICFCLTSSGPVNADEIGQERSPDIVGGRSRVDVPEESKRVRPAGPKLAEDPACVADINRVCGKMTRRNNFAVIDCLQNDVRNDNEISTACQHLVWNYKRNLTTDIRFDSAANEVCGSSLNQISECGILPRGQGVVIPCLIEFLDNITNKNCRAFLRRMESVVFSDYRLVYKFANHCKDDINEFECGRLPSAGDESLPHNQGRTLTCLAEHLTALKNPNCKHELLRVAELQADDYHNDRQLFYACREDRETFCHRVKSGEGRVYKCLFRHKFDTEMSENCQKMLTIRQQLQQEDYKVNMKLAKSCQKSIQENGCVRQMEAVASFRNARMSAILLCLEGAMKDGREVDSECIVELKEVRRSLMEDYQISPQLVYDCSNEIQKHCGGGLHREGKTIHCLMDLAREGRKRNPENRISVACVRALEDVVEAADVGDNFEVDPAIQDACEPVVKTLCRDIQPGEGRMMNCLMNSLDKPLMLPECMERLMEIHYFITRDFRLDARLYKMCRKDANTICNAPDRWHHVVEDMRPPMKQLVFACLYRNLFIVPTDPNQQSVSRGCSFEMKRVMRERALSVDLDPIIESECLVELAKHCSDKTAKSEEMECLEDHLEELKGGCKKAISEYAENADEAPELNDIFQTSCASFWEKYCPLAMRADWQKKRKDDGDDDAEVTADDEIGENLMSCLIRYKHHPSMNDKCRAGIEHHQLITMKTFTLSHYFTEACKSDIEDLCPLVDRNQKKSYVIQCLSDHVRNDTFVDRKHRVSRRCRKYLKFELLQRSESIKLDPDLGAACKSDVMSLCPNVPAGKGAVIECLRDHQRELTSACRRIIFKREQEEAKDPMTDFLMVSKCKSMIKKFCVDEMSSPETIFECLQRNKDDENFDRNCYKAVLSREELRAKDIRLNPILESNCAPDVARFCYKEKKSRGDDEEDNDVLLCLRKIFARKKSRQEMSEKCRDHLTDVIIESAKDYAQDVQLAKSCASEIKLHCLDKITVDGHDERGIVEGCLKELLENDKIKSTSTCFTEVSRIIEESQADVHADIQLFDACTSDLKQHCADVERGDGRQINCLIAIFNSKKIPLDEKCDAMLSHRIKLWQKLSVIEPAVDFQQVASHIAASPSRNYFLAVVVIIIGIIFIGGLFCGRVTKRLRRDIKDR